MAKQVKILINGFEWDLKVTRNMSFWHQWTSCHGHFHHMKDFGVTVPLEELGLTLDSTETHVFMHEPNHSAYNQSVLDLFSSKEKVAALKKKYQHFAGRLLMALKACDKHLTVKNWSVFVNEYARYCPGLMITATIGRIAGERLSERLRVIGLAETGISSTIAAITYPQEHTPLFSSQLGLFKIGEEIQRGMTDEAEKKKRLRSWLEKYQHIPVNFCDEPWTIVDAEKQLALILRKNCAEEIEKLKIIHARRAQDSRKTLKKINDSEVATLAYAIAHGTYINEFRKGVFSKVSLGFRDIFRRIAEKGGSPNWRDCFYLKAEEMADIIFGRNINIAKLAKARQTVAYIATPKGEVVMLDNSDKQKLIDFVADVHGLVKQTSTKNDSTIKGFSANKGIARGIVKIVLSSKDFDKLKPGEILVTTMTSVDFVMIMERAAAFVTNEGGITSHASIVAREMNKPCIIGTKIATKVLRDGDFVEVDANRGVVKIIKSARQKK